MCVKIFLSYCSKDSDIADIVDNVLQKRLGSQVKIARDTRDVAYRESFKAFMDSIHKQDFVLTIVSDNYLKSSACLYEVGEVLKNPNYEERLVFIVLSEAEKKYYKKASVEIAAKVYTPEDRMDYLDYWKDKYRNLKRRISLEEDIESQEEFIKDLKKIRKIIDYDIARFMAILSDRRRIKFSELVMTNFEAIVTTICPQSLDLLNGCDTYEKVLRSAIHTISSITNTDYNQIVLLAKIDAYQFGLVVFADRISLGKQRYRITMMDGIIGNAHVQNRTINIGNTDSEPAYVDAVSETRSELAVPIQVGNKSIGVINSESEETMHYTPEIIQKLESFSHTLGFALDNIGYTQNIHIDAIPYISI